MNIYRGGRLPGAWGGCRSAVSTQKHTSRPLQLEYAEIWLHQLTVVCCSKKTHGNNTLVIPPPPSLELSGPDSANSFGAALNGCLLVANAMQKCHENKAVCMATAKNSLPSLGLIFHRPAGRVQRGNRLACERLLN